MSLSPAEEKDLVERARLGDEQAFESLILIFSTPLYRVVQRLASDNQEAEMVVQEAFWRAWRSLARYQNDRPFFPYLVTIALNVQRDRWRVERWIEPRELEDAAGGLTDPMLAPETQLEEGEQKALLTAAVQRLPRSYRAVIALRYSAELSYEEMAEALDLPVNTVRTHLRRAKQMLRKIMEEQNE